jgi:hypothetical protein
MLSSAKGMAIRPCPQAMAGRGRIFLSLKRRPNTSYSAEERALPERLIMRPFA